MKSGKSESNVVQMAVTTEGGGAKSDHQKGPNQVDRATIAVSTLVARALAHAGVESPHTGAHVFRHSLATAMLREGASLAEIGELLRHRHPDTTTLYAKVDLLALRALALPWPGGGR
jgi:integrase